MTKLPSLSLLNFILIPLCIYTVLTFTALLCPLNHEMMNLLLLFILVAFRLDLICSTVLISGIATEISENKTFELGFFNRNDDSRWYLGIWYASIPTPTYVWVANRETPVKSLDSATVEINAGKLAVKDAGEIVWQSSNTDEGVEVKLLEQGNLVLLRNDSEIVWNSFDFPTDTWLPGMNLSSTGSLVSWKSWNDPGEGKYLLRLNPLTNGELELVYDKVESYWSSGRWNGNAFIGVPEMTIQYIYSFYFLNPFTKMASFGYTETSTESGTDPPLTRFQVDFSGELRQFTWSQQAETWNKFWKQPENHCRVYGLCGNLGFCNARLTNPNPCNCLPGFMPVDGVAWNAGEFSGGCRRISYSICNGKDDFEEVGFVSFDGAEMVSFSGDQLACEKECLKNCSCVGLYRNLKSNACKLVYGSVLNLRNLTSDSTIKDTLFVRSQGGDTAKKNRTKKIVIITTVSGFIAILALVFIVLFVWRKRRIKKRKKADESVFPVTNLKVFSYKELHAATRGFSEKLGHGGFGAVFRGQLLNSSSFIAVKRLERPGGGEKEFRAEVCTIGNIQHVNLVRLRGFCSENLHRLLVYDYMPNGPLSMYLKKDDKNLSWDIRFRAAIGTARGIAYLHEECRNCIIHCDIKPENILLDEDFTAKVSDFGLAKLIGRDFSRVLATMRGTWGYVAPEWISGVAITTKADVYSYGMTLLELIGGRRNVEGPPKGGLGAGGGNGEGEEGSSKGEKWFFPPWAASRIIEGNVAAVVDERLVGVYNPAEAERVGLVAVWCIQDEEELRPAMGMVVKMLEGVVEVGVPPPPKLLQALVSGESFHGVRVDSGGGGGGHSDVELSGESKNSDFNHSL